MEDVLDIGRVKAKTIYVDKAGGGNHTTIQAAINAANNGDTIYVWAGTYNENIFVNKRVSIIGNGSSFSIISGSPISDTVKISVDNVNISGLTIKKSSRSDDGIEMSFADYCRIENCVIQNQNYGIRLMQSHSNQLINNTLKSNTFYGFYLLLSNSNKIIDNVCEWSDKGVYISSSNNNYLRNNTLKRSDYRGIDISNSIGNKIENCNTSNNGEDGIYLSAADKTIIMNNTCLSNSESDIYLGGCKSNTILNNTMATNGLYLTGGTAQEWYSHTIDTKNTANGKPVHYLKNVTSGIAPSDGGQLILGGCTKVTVDNQNYSGVCVGIQLGFSNNLTVKNNNLFLNTRYGIKLESSDWNTVVNNTCNSNVDTGILLQSSDSNTIISNDLKSNDEDGIGLFMAKLNKIVRNKCTYSRQGINVYMSTYNTLDNNTCDSNSFYNILLDVWALNNIVQSNLLTNSNAGVRFDQARYNTIINNTCSWNTVGIYVYNAYQNTIKKNDISKNSQGIQLETGGATIFQNSISSNNNWGITMDSNSHDSLIYHNNFLTNANQARDSGSNNYWHYKGEGNYWTDYTGQDNGANDRKIGDGVGDTNLPHLDLDNYPFVLQSGWLYPTIPTLLDPDDLSLDGNYTLYWPIANRSTGYILEEDLSSAFFVPKTIYEGPARIYDFIKKDNGTYYYRIKSYNDNSESSWSNIVSVIVDWSPQKPKNLIAKDIGGREVTLAWAANPESDIKGYHIFMNETGADANGPFKKIFSISSSFTQFTVKGLSEEKTYHFILIAFDAHSNSSISDIVSATTLDITPPSAPKGLSAQAVSNHEIMLTWELNPEPDLSGYIVYMNDTGNGPGGNYRIIDILGKETKFTVKALAEQTQYQFKLKAFDEIPNNSSFSTAISETTLDETPPAAPTGLNVKNPTQDSLTLSWNPGSDPDVIGYRIFRSKSLNDQFILIDSALVTSTQFINDGLEDDTTYYYKIKAVDDVKLESPYSEIGIGTTELGPTPPEIGYYLESIYILEDSYDDTTIDLYIWFNDRNNDKLIFRCEGQDKIKVTIFPENGTVILRPTPDWNGQEVLTFYATDGIFPEVDVDVTITVTPVNDPPGRVEIIKPEDGIEITEGISIDFEGRCTDPDQIYVDELTYQWSSDLTGSIGEGSILKDVALTVGEHRITLEVLDSDLEKSSAAVNVTVLKSSTAQQSDDQLEASDGFLLAAAGIIVIVVIIIVVLLFYINIKRKKSFKVGDEGSEPSSVLGKLTFGLIGKKPSEPKVGTGPPVFAETEPKTVLPPQQAVPQLPEASKTHRMCPVCKSMLTEETKCVYCGWEKI
jgi:parallel beta-helix repeat protein